ATAVRYGRTYGGTGMKIHLLGATALNRKKEGLYGDGGGLYLQVTRSRVDLKRVNRSWIFRYTVLQSGGQYRVRSMGLGSCDTVSLAKAREKALACRNLRDDGVDPLEHRERERAAAIANAVRTLTFDQCMAGYLAAHRGKWRGEKNAQQWTQSLARYVSP